MSGFEIFLCVLAGIILFFVLILSIPVHISLKYNDKVHLSVRYAFIKLDILPLSLEKKEKKEKKPKKEKNAEPEEEKKEEKPKEKKPNPLIKMLKANGFDGMMEVIENLGSVLATWGGKLLRSVKFNEINVYALVATGDAASTAIKYGETCRKVYPAIGFICSNNLVKKYNVDVSTDFLANSGESEMFLDCQLTIRKIINATIGMVFRMIFKVGLKFIKNGKSKSETKANA